jgi:hypothetical protein
VLARGETPANTTGEVVHAGRLQAEGNAQQIVPVFGDCRFAIEEHQRSKAGLKAHAQFVLGGSEACDELDASSLEIAEEPVLACIAPVPRPASVPPTAVRTVEGEVVDLHRRSDVTTTPLRCCSLRKGASGESAGRRPDHERGGRRRGWLLGHASDSQVCLQVSADQAGSKHTRDACNRGKGGPPPDTARTPDGRRCRGA